MTAAPPERLEQLRAVALDPALFASRLLKHDVWETPAAILRAMNRPRARVAVKACHASSKTFTAGELVTWALVRYPKVKIVTTAPTWHQVKTLLWGEIHKAYAAAAKAIDLPVGPNLTEWRITEGVRFAEGISTNEAVRFQGYHADEGGVVIVILDEAPGVTAEIYEALEGISAGGDVRVLLLGNPTIVSGPFYDAFTKDRAMWDTFTIDAFSTPNLAGLTIEKLLQLSEDELDRNVKPYLITRRWVKERYHKWGPQNASYQARVLGQFPVEAEDALFSLAWIEGAAQREGVDSMGDVSAGLDVAGPGEAETVLCIRHGPSIIGLHAWADREPRGDVIAALMPYRNRLKRVNVDATGIGYYMAKHLADQGFPVRELNAGEAPLDDEQFTNRKGEMYWSFRERLKAGNVNGLEDAETQAQLAGIRYKHDPRGRVVIESKEDARKRGVDSPDRAEAVILAFDERRPQGKKRGEPYRQQLDKVRA